jgi:hypothetical protein
MEFDHLGRLRILGREPVDGLIDGQDGIGVGNP